MIKRLNLNEYNENARQALLKLCGKENPNPFEKPFLATVKYKIIIAGGAPRRNIINAIAIAATKFGDKGFYLHDLEINNSDCDNIKQNYDWYVTFDDINIYGEVTLIDHIDYVYFSPKGVWGIVTSDTHCVIGGSKEFLEEVCSLVPDIQDDTLEFINYWENTKKDYPEQDIDISWLPHLLIDIYGLEESKKLISQAEKINRSK